MIPARQPPNPKDEFIITREEMKWIHEGSQMDVIDVLEDVFKRPHTSATAPEPDEKHLRCDHIKEDCPDMCIHRQFHSIRQCHGLCPIERGRQQCSPDDYVRSRPHPSAQTPAGYTGEDIFGPFIHEHNLKVAKAAREQVLDDLVYWMYDCPFGGREGSDRCHTILAHKIESLRHQQGNNNRMEQ